jgi:hypothetical protein
VQLTHQIVPDTPAQPPMVAPEGVTVTYQEAGDRFMASVNVPAPDPNAPPAPASTDASGARPAWLPEKFKSPEELAKSYAELEKAFHSRSTPPASTPAAPAAAPAAAPTITPPAEAPAGEAPKPALADAAKEVAETGGISEDTYTKLAAAGHDRATVDTFIAGQKAIAAQLRSEIATVAGGDEQLGKVLEWAGKNLSPAQQDAYNAVANTGNVEATKLALQGVVAAYRQANPTEPRFVTGAPASSNGDLAPFNSNAEVVAAMSDPRYAKDPAYRHLVAQRLARSN